jgi:carboxypeptidase Taq
MRSKQAALLDSCASLLGWEEQTMMPPGGVEHRANQMALLAGLVHERRTDPRVDELLASVESSSLAADPLAPPTVNVRELRRDFDRATRLPRELVEELAKTTSTAQHVWTDARRRSDFAAFRPWLERIVELKTRQADAYGYRHVRYDALLDEYEPGTTTAEISRLFDELKPKLVSLVGAIVGAVRQPDGAIVRRDFPVERQRVFGESAAAAIGFDFHRGRLDTTTHPFCSGIGPGDCRITTRFHPNFFNDAFFSILHEVGHGLYEQGLDPQHFGTPMGQAVSLGVHESQSRMWENLVGRSHAFWRHFFPRAQQVFPAALREVSLDAFHFAVNRVERSLIRVDADEATYNLHVLIRFELEQALLSGDLPVGDLPAAWNEKYRSYLGITPPDDARGCLQDIHWSAGLFGYFPTYTLGNAYAAQLFSHAQRELGDLSEPFARGDFSGLLGWLRRKVHREGRRYPPPDLVATITGQPPSPDPLVKTLNEKFAALYGL